MIAHFDSTIDWGILTERAVQRGWQGGVYLALRLAKELAGAEVPVDILERLRPAGLTETLIESARALIFTDPRFAGSISVSFSEVMGNSGFFDKIKILWKRVFLPRDIIAAQYFSPADSIRIYAYYPRRLVDLLRRYGPNLKKIQDKDARVKPLAERKRMVATWLDGCR
jgi:hypothetical protein